MDAIALSAASRESGWLPARATHLETAEMAEYETILVETEGRRHAHHAQPPAGAQRLNSQVLEDLIGAFAAFEADPAALRGADRQRRQGLAAGADIKEMAEKPAVDFYNQDFFARWTSHLVKTTRKPWIAAVNGFALGGGCELAMMADFIIAADTRSSASRRSSWAWRRAWADRSA
jgi:enoyl-CoA hydratase